MKTAKSLADLVSPWLTITREELANIEVTQLELDSRKIERGDTFVAIQGHQVDGRDYIANAIKKGANLVLAQASDELPHGSVTLEGHTPVVSLDQLDTLLSAMAARLNPLTSNKLIAVTGTNGKTTITQLIAQWLELLDSPTAVMGTTGNGFLDNLQPAVNTTGNALEIQRTLYDLEQQGAAYTALEVSSHGLVQGRVKALSFAIGLFSNLSRDHLDYHGTMEEYAKAKFMLFSEHDCPNAVINADDSVGRLWLEKHHGALAVSLKPMQSVHRGVWATQVNYSEHGIHLHFEGTFGTGELKSELIGEFNASNILLAFAALLELGFDKQRLMESCAKLKPVLGRMELFSTKGKAKVVVDYAHTPDALEKALMALRVHCQGQLWTIVGCGGDRDKGKRPMMAEIAERLGDKVILSDDNPRSESPQAIVEDMLAGLTVPTQAFVEHDRYAALKLALEHASEQDIILLAGKGHEDYQVLKDHTVHYSDRESAMELLGLNKA